MASAVPGGATGMDGSKGSGTDRWPPAKPDLNDVKYDAASLANDRTLGDPEVVNVEAGGRVLVLRDQQLRR